MSVKVTRTTQVIRKEEDPCKETQIKKIILAGKEMTVGLAVLRNVDRCPRPSKPLVLLENWLPR